MLSNERIEKIVREYLSNVLHMSLATCVDNKPWVCEVHFVYDDDLNLYWRSKPNRRHSEEIAINPNVAGTIAEQHGVTTKPRALYFEGSAEMLEGIDENSPVYQLFVSRLDTGSGIVEDARQPDGHKFYKVSVHNWYLFDSRASSPSQKYLLEK